MCKICDHFGKKRDLLPRCSFIHSTFHSFGHGCGTMLLLKRLVRSKGKVVTVEGISTGTLPLYGKYSGVLLVVWDTKKPMYYQAKIINKEMSYELDLAHVKDIMKFYGRTHIYERLSGTKKTK